MTLTTVVAELLPNGLTYCQLVGQSLHLSMGGLIDLLVVLNSHPEMAKNAGAIHCLFIDTRRGYRPEPI
jgi:hypothetical protein